MNKYGNEEEQRRFHEWLRVYDKGQEKEVFAISVWVWV